MPSTDRVPPARDPRLFAGALLVASGLQLAELLLPRIPMLPWLRPGLSWIVLLPWLLEFGLAPALALFLCRNVLSMAFGGQPASTFLISSASGIAALALAGTLGRFLTQRDLLGRAGASVLLSTSFNVFQLLLVSWILVGSSGYFAQIGPLLLWSVASGLLVGYLSRPLGDGRGWERLRAFVPESAEGGSLSGGSIPASVLAASAMVVVLCIPDPRPLGLALVVALVVGRAKALRAILATWPFLPYLAWFHLLETPGNLVAGTWITRQGVHQFVVQALKLWAFTACGRILTSHLPWNRLLGSESSWARGLALALPIVPRLFPAATGAARDWWRDGRTGGLDTYLDTFARRLHQDR